MSSDIVKRQTMEIDSIDDFDDTIVGGEGGRGASGFLPEGGQIKFTRTERWENKAGEDLTGTVILHLDTLRTEVRWGKDGKPVGPPRILGPGEQYRDTDAINETIPKSEWVAGFEKGELRGPVQNQNVVVLGNLATMERYVWPSPVTTIGSAICVRELCERVKRARKFRGGRVYAKVKFARAPFPTRYNKLQQRPHLEIISFVEPTEDGLREIDPNATPSLQQVSAPKVQADPAPGAREVAEPTLREEMQDELKY
jgi:hypothetical protein